MTVEKSLAQHLKCLRLVDIDAAALAAFDRLLLDFVAVLVAGRNDAECGQITRALDSMPFAWGTAAHWFDWDDTHDASHVHGGAVIFPAVLTAFRMSQVAPEDFTAATIAAYDVACRLGGFLKARAHRGWMPTGSGATVAAAGAVARIFGMDEAGVLSAMGMAAANAGLSRQALADRTNAKATLAGIAAKNAVESALLARAGVNGPPHFLTGVYGLHALHAGSQGDGRDALTALGSDFSVVDVSLKPYPCCRSTHAVIDGVLGLRQENSSFASRVDAVEACVPVGVFERCGAPFVVTDSPRLAAQFSIPFTTALSLRHGAPSLKDFTAENVLRTAQTMAKDIDAVTVHATSQLGDGDALAPVFLRFSAGGEIVERHVPVVSGSAAAPLTIEQQREKLKSAAGSRLSDGEIALLEETAMCTSDAGPAALIACLEKLIA